MSDLETLAKAWGTNCENPLQKLVLLSLANGIQNSAVIAAKSCATTYETERELARMVHIGMIGRMEGKWVLM